MIGEFLRPGVAPGRVPDAFLTHPMLDYDNGLEASRRSYCQQTVARFQPTFWDRRRPARQEVVMQSPWEPEQEPEPRYEAFVLRLRWVGSGRQAQCRVMIQRAASSSA